MSEPIFALSYINQESHNVVLKSCPSLKALGVSPYYFIDPTVGALVVLHPDHTEYVVLDRVFVWVYQEGQCIVCRYPDVWDWSITSETFHEVPVHYRYHLMTFQKTSKGEAPYCLELYRCYRHLDEAWEDFKYLTLSGQVPLLLDRVSGEPVEA